MDNLRSFIRNNQCLLLFCIVLIVVVLVVKNQKNNECFTSETPLEAVQTLASMYNNGNVSTTNMTVQGEANIGSNVIGQNSSLTGNLNMNNNNINNVNGITAETLMPVGNNALVIGSENNDLLLNTKYYAIPGVYNGGDLSNQLSYYTLQNAIQTCKSAPSCNVVYTQGGTGFWLKGSSNNWNWIIGGTNLPPELTFAGYLDNVNNATSTVGTVSSLSQCRQLAITNGSSYYQYSPTSTSTNCMTWTTATNPTYVSYFIPKY